MNLKENTEHKIRKEKEKLRFSWRWDFPIPTILGFVIITGKSIFDSWKDYLPGTTDWLDLFIERYVTKGNVAYFIIWAVILSIFFCVTRRLLIYRKVAKSCEELTTTLKQELYTYEQQSKTNATNQSTTFNIINISSK